MIAAELGRALRKWCVESHKQKVILKVHPTYNHKTRFLRQPAAKILTEHCQTNTINVNTLPNFKLLSLKTFIFVASCGIRFHSCWWNNVLIRKPGAARIISFPALSYLLPSTREKKKEEYRDGELTWLSDSLLCWRIIFLQLTAFWLGDIFTKSDLATDLNAKWTLRTWTTFHLRVPSPL